MTPEKRATILEVLDESPHGYILAARMRVTMDTPCTGCGETMEDEFLDEDRGDRSGPFDGVMNDAGQPFHHGCEDF